MRKAGLFCLFLLMFGIGRAVSFSGADSAVLRGFWEYAAQEKLQELPVDQRLVLIGKFFLGSPYKSGTLNVVREEMPVINLRQFDCVTFVENTLALAFLEKYEEASLPQFVDNILKLRYRGGKIEDYTSRLHYSSDWLYEMKRLHYVEDVTQEAGGIPYALKVGFMSEHPAKYPALAADAKLVRKMKDIETAVNARSYYYVPKAEIGKMSRKIRSGDIVLITTNIKGLDTSHLGIAVKNGKRTFLMHASSGAGKVVVTTVPLEDYMKEIKSQTGIMIARPNIWLEKKWLVMP